MENVGDDSMTLIISKNSIEARIRKETAMRAEIRRSEAIGSGLTKTNDAHRKDYRQARENDKILSDYKRFKEPKAREEIKKAYFAEQEKWKSLKRGG